MRVLIIILCSICLFLGAVSALLLLVLAFDGQDLQQPAGAAWYAYDSFSLNSLQAFVQRVLSPGLWDVLAVNLLILPLWSSLLLLAESWTLLGLVFAVLIPRKTRRMLF